MRLGASGLGGCDQCRFQHSDLKKKTPSRSYELRTSLSDSVRLRSDGDSIVSKPGATVAFTRLTCQTQPLHLARLFFGGAPTANTSSTQPVPDSRAPHGRSVEYFLLRVIRKKTVVGKQNAYGYASQEPLLLLSVGGSPAHPLRCWYIAPAAELRKRHLDSDILSG